MILSTNISSWYLYPFATTVWVQSYHPPPPRFRKVIRLIPKIMIFALNWQHTASSPLTFPVHPYLWWFTLKMDSPSPKTIFFTYLFNKPHPPNHWLIGVDFGRDSPSPKKIFFTYLFNKPHPPTHWLIREDSGRLGQPVNTSGKNQVKTSL